jgi:hypothetical protein
MESGRPTDALLGRARSRTIAGVIGGFVLFGLTLAVTVGLYQFVDGLWGARWWISLVVLPIVAGAYAYWNDGFLVSLWLSGMTAFAMYWGFNNAVALSRPLVPFGILGTTVLTAVRYGIGGYVGGRFLWRRWNRDEVSEPSSEWLVELLGGSNRTRSAWTIVLSVGLFAAGVSLTVFIHEPGSASALQRQLAIRDFFRLVDLLSLSTDWRFAALLAWIGLPTALAFWNDGYVGCWVSVFGAAYGVNVGLRLTQGRDVGQALFEPMLQVLIHALVLGTLGFALGVSLRRAFSGIRSERSDSRT